MFQRIFARIDKDSFENFNPFWRNGVFIFGERTVEHMGREGFLLGKIPELV